MKKVVILGVLIPAVFASQTAFFPAHAEDAVLSGYSVTQGMKYDETAGRVTGEYEITADSADEIWGAAALYADGALKRVKTEKITPQSGKKTSFSVSVDTAGVEEGEVKLMLRKKNGQPVTEVMMQEIRPVNLLLNGDFESEPDGKGNVWSFLTRENWYMGTTDTGERTVSERRGGDYSLKLKNATAGQRVTLEAGKTYKLTAYIKSGASASVDIGFYDGASDYPSSNGVKTENVNVTAEWKAYSVNFECDASKDYVICIASWDGAEIYADDVTLTETHTEFDGGGIVNGSFDAGMDGWTAEGSGAAVSGGVLRISGTDYDTRVSQQAESLQNGVYNLTAYASTDNIEGAAYVYAKTSGSTASSTAIPQSGSPVKIVVPSVTVTDGRCEAGICASGSATVTIDRISLEKSEETRVPFLKGGEISKLTYVENQGGRFYRADGSEADALQIMAENGFNLARIRVLNDPGKGHGDGTYYLPADYMTEEDCLSLARRAKDKGMHILFSFAYSDYWVDGDKQMIPHEWQEYIDENSLTGESKYQYLETQVYEYTKKVLTDLKNQGTEPEFVAIGNEIQVGMLFNKYGSHDTGIYNNSAMLARFLNAGSRAVREILPNAKIVLHSDNGGKLTRRTSFVNALKNVDFDVIGVSYYPFYNADVSIDTVAAEFSSFIGQYNKDVIIMETGYNWSHYTPYVYDGVQQTGQLQNSGYYTDIYGETQNGQRAFLTELYAKMKQVSGGRCIADLYWDPVMIYDGGADHANGGGIGWAIEESYDWTQNNVVPNSTIFDFEGTATAGQLAMKYNTNASDKVNITGRVTTDGETVKNTKIAVTVNGAEYTVTTDKFGEYIVSVPYPSDGALRISGKDGASAAAKQAPVFGVMVNGVNFDGADVVIEEN